MPDIVIQLVDVNVINFLLIFLLLDYIQFCGVNYIQLRMCEINYKFTYFSYSYNSELADATGLERSVIGYITLV